MSSSIRIIALFLLVSLPTTLSASPFPSSLSATDIDRVVEIIGGQSVSRLMRSAEPYPTWPGVKIGLEVPLVLIRDMDSVGNGQGTLPGLNPLPRLYIAKGLFPNVELILNYFPPSVFNSLATFGGIVKWTVWDEKDTWLETAFFLGITSVTAYADSYNGLDEEIGIEVSKDYVRMKPYLGLGLLFAEGSVNGSLAGSPNVTSGFYSTIHSFLGAELEMPVHVTLQLDLFNLAPGGSIMVGKHFF